ncbi:MAG TPA: hypothetical protein VFQ53_34410 [Kofleriaceae bacterium]|nr:hypothetical protein [Kofleriaceae bacterium]
MKLVGMTFLALLLAAPVASADVLHPPGGPVDEDDAAIAGDVDLDTDADAPVQLAHDPQQWQQPPQGAQQPGRPPRDPQARARRMELRRLLLAELDVNHDGKLGPRERQRGIRILRRLEMKLAGRGGQGNPRAQMRKFIERYDVNGDGNVGPDEVPAGAARRLRRFDRDRDGWVEPRELPQQRR